MCILKTDTNELIYKTEVYSQILKRKLWLSKGKGWSRDKLGNWDWQIYTTTYKTEKQQGPTVQHRKLYLISRNNLKRKRI